MKKVEKGEKMNKIGEKCEKARKGHKSTRAQVIRQERISGYLGIRAWVSGFRISG